MKKRLQTVLSHAGVASRRRAAEIIEEGKVSIDGRVVTERGFRVDPEECEIIVEGKVLREEEKKCYFLFNKPENVISTVQDTHSRKKIADFFKDIKARLYPIGRLDKDTTGLMIMTNDGDLAHALSHPSFEIDKEYIAAINRALTREDLEKLEKGIVLDGKKTAECEIKHIKEEKPGFVYKIILHEGKKRQIRRMIEVTGKRVVKLKRVKYAGLIAGKLKEGQYRELTDVEVTRLKALKN